MYKRVTIGTGVLFLAVSLTACGSTGKNVAVAPSARPSAAASTALPTMALPTAAGTSQPGTPVASRTGQPAGDVTVTEKDNGTTLTLVAGQRVRVVLSSTYWQFQDSSDPAVLRADGQPRVSPQPSGCVPGAGCGTATATFLAVASGSAEIKATRTSCGEAMGCTGNEGLYTLRVTVR